MASELERFENKEVEDRLQESSEDMQSANTIRGGMSALLRDEDFRRTVDKEALRNYDDVAQGRGHIKPGDKANLSKFYKFMKEQYEEVKHLNKRISGRIDEAIKSNIISDKDREFYEGKMNENVVNGGQNVTREIMEKAETELTASLKKREEERKEYDLIVQGPLVEDGQIKVEKGKTIKVPDEKGYLAMKVPERRKWLKEVKDALPKAKHYKEKEGGIESKKLEGEYEGLLAKAQKEGVVGKATIQKFRDEFKNIDLKEKKYWLKEMKNGNQLKRYQKFWKEARKALSDIGYKRLAGQKDKLGYSQLVNELGKEKEKEGRMIEGEYGKKLAGLVKKRVISKHTERAFLEDIKRQPHEKKKDYLKAFDSQMQRYKALRIKIDQMKDGGSRKVLDEMYDSGENGHSEINAKYQRLSGQSSNTEANPKLREAEKELDAIENRSVRKALKVGMGKIEKSQKRNLADRLTSFFEGRLSAKIDPLSYQKTLSDARGEHRQVNIKEIKAHHRPKRSKAEKDDQPKKQDYGSRANTLSDWEMQDDIAVLDSSTSKDDEPVVTKDEYKKKLPHRAKTHVNATKTFVRKTFYTESDKEKHVMRAQINSKEGVNSLNSIQGINRQTDDLSVNVWADNRVNELKLDDVRATIRYLRKNIANTTEEAEKKAA